MGGDGDGEGWVIQLLSGREGATERGRVDAGRLVAMVVMVLDEYTDDDLVGERLTLASGPCLIGACSMGKDWMSVRGMRETG